MNMRSSILISVLLAVTHCSATSHDLVDILTVNPTIKVALMYTRPDNFAKRCLYPRNARCYIRASVAPKLDAVQKELRAKGLGLKIYDAYRPLSVQKALWKAFPDDSYVANPYTRGSCHNRGVAVDLTVVNLKTGKELSMPTKIDDLSSRAHHDYMGATKTEIANRELLKDVMMRHGFVPIKNEWWHYNDANWQQYDLLDIDFEQLASNKK